MVVVPGPGIALEDDEVALRGFCSGETQTIEKLMNELPLAVRGKVLPKKVDKKVKAMAQQRERPVSKEVEQCQDEIVEEILTFAETGGRLSLPESDSETPMTKFDNFVHAEEGDDTICNTMSPPQQITLESDEVEAFALDPDFDYDDVPETPLLDPADELRLMLSASSSPLPVDDAAEKLVKSSLPDSSSSSRGSEEEDDYVIVSQY